LGEIDNQSEMRDGLRIGRTAQRQIASFEPIIDGGIDKASFGAARA
jgi:hypothetical protein